MWPVTQRYLDTIARPHEQHVYVEIIKDGRTTATLQQGVITDPATGDPLYTLDGTVQVDKTTIRRSGRFTLLDPSGSLLPDTADDLLAPYVTEIRAWVGVRYWNSVLPALSTAITGMGTPVLPVLQQDVEYVPIGTLVITDLDSANYPQINLECYDRMWLLGEFTAPYSISAGTDPVVALTSLLSANVPGTRYSSNFPSGSETTTPALAFDAETSIADACHDIANSVGWQLYVDPLGTFTATVQPSTNDDPVLVLAPGSGSIMFRPHRTIGSSTQVYNAVVYTGEGGSTSPVRGYAQDDDPGSLTYVGRIGTRPYFASSPLITTNNQANLAARTTLAGILGVADQVSVPIMPIHAMECGDVIHVTDNDQDINENLIVDSFPINLRASGGPMELVCRSSVIR